VIMQLEWSNEKIGPNVWVAPGATGVWLVVNRPDRTPEALPSAVLYLMAHGVPLCPINVDRAIVRRDYVGHKAFEFMKTKAQQMEYAYTDYLRTVFSTV